MKSLRETVLRASKSHNVTPEGENARDIMVNCRESAVWPAHRPVCVAAVKSVSDKDLMFSVSTTHSPSNACGLVTS